MNSVSFVIHDIYTDYLQGEFILSSPEGFNLIPFNALSKMTGLGFFEIGLIHDNFFDYSITLTGELIYQESINVLRFEFSALNPEECYCQHGRYMISGEFIDGSLWFNFNQVMEDFPVFKKHTE